MGALERGTEAMARAAWPEARDLFEEAVLEDGSAEAWELLGAAAWWLDDAEAVFTARDRAWQLYRERGDLRGAARVAITIADDFRYFRGETAIARGWQARARRLLEAIAPSSEHGWLEVSVGDLALFVDADVEAARRHAAAALGFAAQARDLDLEMVARALDGLVRVRAGEVGEGMPRLDEAATAALGGEVQDPLAAGYCCCYLVFACEQVRDLERAAQWCRRLEEHCRRLAFNTLFAVCRAQLGGVLVLRGLWSEAERALDEAARRLSAIRPAMQDDALVRLAELRRRQGRWDEAERLLDRAEPGPAALLVQAELALDRGEAASASHLAERCLRRLASAGAIDRMGALDALVRARVALGEVQSAHEPLDEVRATAARVGTDPVRGAASLLEGRVLAASDDADGARRALEDAIDLFARIGMPYEAAVARTELGALLASSAPDLADRELAAAREALERLGAERAAARAGGMRKELAPRDPRPGGLSRREIEVLRLVAQGKPNAEIAKALFVSEFTVKRHVANILARLRLRTRAAAAAFAVRAGIV